MLAMRWLRCYPAEIEAAGQTFFLVHLQYDDSGPASLRSDSLASGRVATKSSL